MILSCTKAGCSASVPSTPTSQRSSGIRPELEGKSNQLQAFTPDAKKVAERAKIYFNLYLTSRNAFPSPVELKQFQNNAVENANKDLKDRLIMHPGFAQLVRAYRSPMPRGPLTPSPPSISLRNVNPTTVAGGKTSQALISRSGTNFQTTHMRSKNEWHGFSRTCASFTAKSSLLMMSVL